MGEKEGRPNKQKRRIREMSELVLPQRGANNPGALIRAMLTMLRRYWTEAEGYQHRAGCGKRLSVVQRIGTV